MSTFFFFRYVQTLYQLYILRQGGKTINQYIDDFYQLVIRNDLLKIEEQMVTKYLSGLR